MPSVRDQINSPKKAAFFFLPFLFSSSRLSAYLSAYLPTCGPCTSLILHAIYTRTRDVACACELLGRLLVLAMAVVAHLLLQPFLVGNGARVIPAILIFLQLVFRGQCVAGYLHIIASSSMLHLFEHCRIMNNFH